MQADKQDIQNYAKWSLERTRLQQLGVYMPNKNANDDLAYVVQL